MSLTSAIKQFSDEHQELSRIVRFIFVGGLATLVDIIVCALLISLVGADNWQHMIGDAFGASSTIGNFLQGRFEEIVSIIAFCVAFSVTYYGQSGITFRKKRSKEVLFKQAVVSIASLILIVLFVAGIKLILGWENNIAPMMELPIFHIEFSASYIPLLIAMVLVTAISYVGSKYWVFKNADNKNAE